MKKWWIVGIVIIFIIILGFIIGLILPATNAGCTLMGCFCQGNDGEKPCNSCSFSDQVFTTGILNAVKKCSASEFIICENNKQVGTRIDLENKICRIDWILFGYNLKYLKNNPNEIVTNNVTSSMG